MTDIRKKIHAQLDAARSAGNLACAFSIAETMAILNLIQAQHDEFVRMENSWRREINRIRDEYQDEADYDLDNDYGTVEDRDCAYWERVMRDE